MTARILFVCEGESDEAFFEELIKKRHLKGFGIFPIKEGETAGSSGFGKRLKGLQTETGIEACRLIVVVGDNDSTPAQSFSLIKKQIRSAGNLGVPEKPRVIVPPSNVPPNRHVPDLTVLMLPWDNLTGNLETMCFAAGSAKRPGLARCVKAFVKCARVGKWTISKLSKLQVRCMLAVLCKKNPDVSFKWSWTKTRGAANPFPVSQSCFNTVVGYLRSLEKGQQ